MLIPMLMLLTSGNTYKIHKSAPMENVKKVVVEVDNADVSIQKNNSMHLDADLVQHRCGENILNKYTFEVEKEKDIMYISVKKKDMDFELHKCSLELVLELPHVNVLKVNSLAGDISVKDFRSDSIEVRTRAGDVYMDNFKTDNLIVKVLAGDIRIEGSAIANNVSLETTSGDISVKDFRSDSIEVRTRAGDVYMDNFKTDNLIVKVLAGDIRIEGSAIANNVSLETTSGDVYVKKHPELKKLEIETKSGNIDIEGNLLKKEDKILAEASSGDIKCLVKNIDKGVKISASTKSGNIESSVPIIVGDDEDCNVIFKARGGDIIISY